VRPSIVKLVSSVPSFTGRDPSKTLYSVTAILSVDAAHEKLILVDVNSSSIKGPGCEGAPISRDCPGNIGAELVGEIVGSSGTVGDNVGKDVDEPMGEFVLAKPSEGMGEGGADSTAVDGAAVATSVLLP
jgi:hypothetical protein